MIEINNKKLCESCFAETGEEKCPHCGYSKEEYTADPMVLPLGTKLNDKIIVGKVMGKGGFGITYLGYDLRMEKTIAVKEYYPNGIAYRSQSGTEVLVADPKSNETFDKGTEKFYSEAEMVAQFNGNPNIVGVYDYFRANNTVYLIMEYLNGITLKNYVKKYGNINDGQALFVMDKIAAALSITHSAGVLHRDISPDNIMVCLDGKIKLIDFGAARQIVAESSSNLTVVMKPGYTPIEQYTKKGRQGAWTDIYALGASIYFAMTGTVIDDPYERMDSDDEFAENKHGINNDLWNVIKKSTMINASDRFGSAIELRKALSGVSSPIKPEPLPLNIEDMKAAAEDEAKEAAEASANLIASTTGPIERFTEGEEGTSEEPAVQTEGYNPDENVYIKTEKEKKPLNKKLLFGAIGGVAAVAAIVVGIVLFVNRPENELPANVNADGTNISESGTSLQKIFINNSDTLWSLSRAISKETLQSFGGDVKITLDIATTNNNDHIFQHSFFRHTIAPRSDAGDVLISADNGYVNGNNEWDLYEPEGTFVFILKKAQIDAMEGYLTFQPNRVELNSATVETYIGAGDEFKTVTFNEQYPGDWDRHETYISKEDLMSYGGDVRVEVEYQGVSGYTKHYIKTIDEDWNPVIVDVPNMKPDDEETVYVLYNHPFVFNISRELIEKLSDRGLGFQTEGLVVNSVRLRTPDYGKGESGGNSQNSTNNNSSATTTAATTTTTTTTAVTTIPESAINTSVLTFDLDDSDPGSWSYGKLIKVSDFSPYFTEDIKVTLEIECVKDILSYGDWAGVYSYFLDIHDRSGSSVIKSTFNMAIIEPPDGGFFFGPLGNKYAEPDGALSTFEFVLTQEDVDRIDGYMRFKGENCFVRSATFETYDPNEYAAVSENAEKIELGVQWSDDLGEGSTGISKSKLESFGGDVRITLDVEGELFSAEDNTGISHLWVRDMADSRAIGVYIRNQGLAEAHAQQDDRDGAPSYVLGDWTLMPKQIDLVIIAEQIHELSGEDGLYFQILNGHVKAAYLEPA